MPPKKLAERKAMRISELVELISKKQIPIHVNALVLESCVNDKDGEDVFFNFSLKLILGGGAVYSCCD